MLKRLQERVNKGTATAEADRKTGDSEGTTTAGEHDGESGTPPGEGEPGAGKPEDGSGAKGASDTSLGLPAPGRSGLAKKLAGQQDSVEGMARKIAEKVQPAPEQ